jgi:lipopolysaccharide biosynthesis glycosyltransferase
VRLATRCVCYTTDPGYLFPTVVSAIQAKRHIDRNDTDVLIYAFGVPSEMVNVFAPVCEAEGIRLIPADAKEIGHAPVMLARLFLAELLPSHYRTFLYVDGDTQISGSIDPLLGFPVPDGHFLAANDPITFALSGNGRHSRDLNAHMASIGLTFEEARQYFNTGVLLADRNGWSRIGPQAWEMFARGGTSRFPDQDVLNLVGGSQHLPLSLAWNFPVFMFNARVAQVIEPRLVHFMSNPKPWQGAFAPWGEAACRPYVQTVARFPHLSAYASRMGWTGRVRYHLQQRYKQILETFTWGLSGKRDDILRYELTAFARVGPSLGGRAEAIPLERTA